jgi:murein L,D-transpeptidase YcbB/YkuD
MVPKIIQDPSFLVDNHLEMIGPGGYVVDGAVSEDMLEQLRIGMLRLRQTPGNTNALGLVKFVFPNQYDVFMHGTPALSLFSRARRDFSHGCVRLERADELAEWVLSKESGWSRDRVVKAMHGSDSLVVNLSHPIQVVTMYATAVTLENGEVDFFNDIYGQDDVLDKAMASR